MEGNIDLNFSIVSAKLQHVSTKSYTNETDLVDSSQYKISFISF